jgi:DNA-binding response OmpR family regulator
MACKVLIATSDAGRAGALAQAFTQKGAMPTVAFDASQLVEFVDVEQFDLVTFDLRIVKEGGWGIVRSVLERASGGVLGLSHGDADDARLAALGVRSQVPANAPPAEIADAAAALFDTRVSDRADTRLTWPPLELATGRREAFWAGRPLPLTKLQFRVLTVLVEARGNVVSLDRLSRVVYGNAGPDAGERMLAHVRRIRKKIEPSPSHPRFLLTVRGEGFRLVDTREAEARECVAS